MTRHATTMMTLVLALASWGARVEAAIHNVRLPPYNAAGNGVADDSLAIQNAIDAADLAGGGEIYIPAGTYRLTTTLFAFASLTFRGEGQRSSIMRWDGMPNSWQGIWWRSSGFTVHKTMTMRGLSFVRNGGTGGAAIIATWLHLATPFPITYTTGGGVTAVVEDIHIGSTGAGTWWETGITLRNAAAAKIATFNIQGGGATTGIAGIEITGHTYVGGDPGRSVGVAVHDGTITGFSRGIKMMQESEVLNAQNIVMRDVYYGFELLNCGRGTSISNNQIWVQHRGISSYNSLGDVAITNNQIYRETDQLFFGIEANNDVGTAWRYRIIGNNVFSPGGATQPRYGITLVNNVRDSIVNANTTKNMTIGVWILNSPVTNNLVYGNINTSAGTTIADGGTNTYKANNW